jgi:hypothetical protein
LERDELCINECVFDVFVAEQSHYVKDVFGFVVFHSCFPVSESVEGDLVDSWVLEFAGCSSASLDSKTLLALAQSQTCFGMLRRNILTFFSSTFQEWAKILNKINPLFSGMSDKKADKSTWAIGGGVIVGLGVGFFFLQQSPLYFVGSLMLGLGLGIVISANISRKD